ncbi:uncharacterized protein LOC125178026 [Hyalella azteca]|uniref:Uncharacterized protein LOC125178026 n=1 Tax=Hyalella azteca TaxID=294128 RepID=A0A979FJG6_HYAAZ|nr:uncharacterized protein LOC125178026 [Hyalella azteca]
MEEMIVVTIRTNEEEQKARSSCAAASKKAKKAYEKAMSPVTCPTGEVLGASSVLKLHSDSKDQAMAVYDELTQHIVKTELLSLRNEIRAQLEGEIDRSIKPYVEMDERKQRARTLSNAAYNKALQMYEEAMDKVTSFDQEPLEVSSLNEKHLTSKDEAIAAYQREHQNSESINLIPVVKEIKVQLERIIDKKYSSYSESNARNSDAHSCSKVAQSQALASYKEKMDSVIHPNSDYVDSIFLENQHLTAKSQACDLYDGRNRYTINRELFPVVNELRTHLEKDIEEEKIHYVILNGRAQQIGQAVTAKFKMVSKNDYAIGIDLGTYKSCVGVVRNGRVEIIADERGSRLTPSFVAFTDEERLIGESAKLQRTMNPANTVYEVKRLIGRKFSDEAVRTKLAHWPYRVVNDKGNPKICVQYLKNEKFFTPEEISAMVLSKMKIIAEKYLGCEVRKAVITVPAYFTDSQRRSTIDAGIIAGFQELKIINEPTAAAIAYGIDTIVAYETNILVFDFGGRTFNVAVLKRRKGNYEVKSVEGNSQLGGRDIDCRVGKFLIDKFRDKTGLDVSNDINAQAKITKAAEQTTINLSLGKMLEEKFQNKEIKRTINPEEVVAYGAAVQAAMLNNDRSMDRRHIP